MNLAEAKALGLKYKSAKRVGRGSGSGSGKTAGRGHNGAKSRSGWSRRVGWEGGQMPLYRRLPKRGFNNKIFTKVYTIINVSVLDAFEDGATVDLAAVLSRGLTSKEKGSDLFKVLGDGELKRKLVVKADAMTKSARAKIEGAGGSVEIIEPTGRRPKFGRKDGPVSKKKASPAAAPEAAAPEAAAPEAAAPATDGGESAPDPKDS